MKWGILYNFYSFFVNKRILSTFLYCFSYAYPKIRTTYLNLFIIKETPPNLKEENIKFKISINRILIRKILRFFLTAHYFPKPIEVTGRKRQQNNLIEFREKGTSTIVQTKIVKMRTRGEGVGWRKIQDFKRKLAHECFCFGSIHSCQTCHLQLFIFFLLLFFLR